MFREEECKQISLEGNIPALVHFRFDGTSDPQRRTKIAIEPNSKTERIKSSFASQRLAQNEIFKIITSAVAELPGGRILCTEFKKACSARSDKPSTLIPTLKLTYRITPLSAHQRRDEISKWRDMSYLISGFLIYFTGVKTNSFCADKVLYRLIRCDLPDTAI
ncbi:hypothetical protein CEXT_623641 [Caerostris extrusa]|uniref:Uncharacterized protein n=1 Tax=Caerostris extrusa TaxID=172846 RepID=A0AAV4PLP7_CAEEX|nr:hypothetical protein CEXT_623641 [Caerostris extrusa]